MCGVFFSCIVVHKSDGMKNSSMRSKSIFILAPLRVFICALIRFFSLFVLLISVILNE